MFIPPINVELGVEFNVPADLASYKMSKRTFLDFTDAKIGLKKYGNHLAKPQV